MQRELEVLSEQYSQKCLENAHLAQALEAERQALRQCQRENQELNAHNQVSRRPGEPELELGAGPHVRWPRAPEPRSGPPSTGFSLTSDVSWHIDGNSLRVAELGPSAT